MVIVQIIVNLLCIISFYACLADYCEICSNHTLCKYKISGPSPVCQSYDNTALLTNNEITELVSKINERRNFIALGYSKSLPQAANMKKIYWSPELATFAQRWVDQCDQFIRPDREDQCRDLENTKVGQNVASVAGQAPGLNVKSFIEMWFINILEYSGNVIYYNQSRDYKTNYFTQLIWADTEFVGCGKAKFNVLQKNTMLERLVCNYAPKGNIHGKPVYVIGYPATQCPSNMSPDYEFKGLCSEDDRRNAKKLRNQSPPVNSLLRILNLSNNSLKQEIDPLGNNLKQINSNRNASYEQRNPKTRHVLINNTHSALKRVPTMRKQNFRKSLINMSRSDDEYLYQQKRGHSHVYHGHVHETSKYNYMPIKDENINKDFRRHDYTTEPFNSFSTQNYRKYNNQHQQCTRGKGGTKKDCVTSECTTNHCTRGVTEGCKQMTICPSTFREIPFVYPVERHVIPHELCPCTKGTCLTTPSNCNCNINCQCLSGTSPTKSNCFTTPCPRIHRMQDHDFKDDSKKSDTFQYYDMPNIVVKSANVKPKEEITLPKEIPWIYNSGINQSYKKLLESKESDNNPNPQVKDIISYTKNEDQYHDYIYRSFDSSIRERRQIEDETFWEIDDKNYENIPQLKSLRYTTLGNKKNRKSRKHVASISLVVSTEPITIKLADMSNHNSNSQTDITEKYLSFDELMHLRKFSGGYNDYGLRRKGATTKKVAKQITKATAKTTTKATTKTAVITKTTIKATTAQTMKATTKATTKAPIKISSKIETTEITTNTPFERKKHCTRKLTCTWTAFTGIGLDGNLIGPGGGELDMGSRTPPGYVDGCTRTSTCTREFMNRNRMSTLHEDIPRLSTDEPVPNDEDYCERRSLKVRRRNLDEKNAFSFYSNRQNDYTYTSIDDRSEVIPNVLNANTQSKRVTELHGCNCNDGNVRKKRQENLHDTKDFSYSDLYYLILNKIIKTQKNSEKHQSKGCQCTSNSLFKIETSLIFVIIAYFTTVLV